MTESNLTKNVKNSKSVKTAQHVGEKIKETAENIGHKAKEKSKDITKDHSNCSCKK